MSFRQPQSKRLPPVRSLVVHQLIHSIEPHKIFLELTISALASYISALWPIRPRGWTRKDLLEVRPSPVAGDGVFAVVPIPAGTVLGGYPGRPRTSTQMAAKCVMAPSSQYYCFKNRHGRYLDPTDVHGVPSKMPGPGLWWFPVDVCLAYANEPPIGGNGTNATVVDDDRDGESLLFVAHRDIDRDEEIFIDYFTDYDRSNYIS